MITLCDEGKRLFAEYKHQEEEMYNKIHVSIMPCELSEEFYQACQNYINHIDNCDKCVVDT